MGATKACNSSCSLLGMLSNVNVDTIIGGGTNRESQLVVLDFNGQALGILQSLADASQTHTTAARLTKRQSIAWRRHLVHCLKVGSLGSLEDLELALQLFLLLLSAIFLVGFCAVIGLEGLVVTFNLHAALFDLTLGML